MAQSSSIEWTDATWNPVVGCRKVSAGCKNCYAERMATRLASMAKADAALGKTASKKTAYLQVINNRGRWNGSVYLDELALSVPLGWRSPRVIFVNSMSDLFHEDVTSEFIINVFDVMRQCPQHTFQVLTKRPERVAALSDRLHWGHNVWMGTSVENQHVVDRVKHLRKSGAKTKFLSVEPLIGPIPRLPVKGIDWVIVGGESGPGARPMEEAWVRQIRDRCISQKVAFFFKQWGGVNKAKAGRILDDRTWDDMPKRLIKGEEPNELVRFRERTDACTPAEVREARDS